MLNIMYPAPQDYTQTSDDLVFVADETMSHTLCRNISIVPDAIVENVETFKVSVNSENSRVIISRQNATVTILDSSGKAVIVDKDISTNDSKLCYYAVLEVSFENLEYTIDEGNGSLSVCLLLNTTLDRNVLLSIQSQSLTAQSRLSRKLLHL